MRRETKPRGHGGIKPLRGWETLGADGVGEVNRRTTITMADFVERHRTSREVSLDPRCGRFLFVADPSGEVAGRPHVVHLICCCAPSVVEQRLDLMPLS